MNCSTAETASRYKCCVTPTWMTRPIHSRQLSTKNTHSPCDPINLHQVFWFLMGRRVDRRLLHRLDVVYPKHPLLLLQSRPIHFLLLFTGFNWSSSVTWSAVVTCAWWLPFSELTRHLSRQISPMNWRKTTKIIHLPGSRWCLLHQGIVSKFPL